MSLCIIINCQHGRNQFRQTSNFSFWSILNEKNFHKQTLYITNWISIFEQSSLAASSFWFLIGTKFEFLNAQILISQE